MEVKKPLSIQDIRSNILEFVRRNGPVLPVQLSKAIGKDITFAGAILSELVANKKVMISKGKVGGSPLYYMQGQEVRLQKLEGHLNGKEKEAFRMLRDKKILNEREVEPAIRVALKEITDFAVPINVLAEDGRNETFFKWYLVKDDDVKAIISSILEPGKTAKPEPIAEAIEINKMELVKQEVRASKQEVLRDFVGETEIGLVREKKIEVKTREKRKESKVNFDDVDSYLQRKRIDVLSKDVSKKGKEIDLIAYVPSELGKVKFFIAYRNKKKINETDIGMIFGKSQVKNLPAILLSNGELTKKAKENLERDFRSVTFYKIN